MSLVAEVAKKLGIKLEVLERDAVKLWLMHRLRVINAEITSILIKYNATSLEEIESRIQRGELPEHPTWEDVITLENLLEEKRRIIEVLQEI